MSEKQAEYYGTTRITNLRTLQRWIDSGKYQAMLDQGWIFNPGCGRFRSGACTCHKCRKLQTKNR